MIGYHYTSYDNWKRIKKEGLKIYRIYREELKSISSDGINGIFVWKRKFRGLPHVGSVIYQMANKGCLKSVLIQVEYSDNDILRYGGNRVSLCHKGTIDSVHYHTGKEEAWIITKDIPCQNIRLIGIYDIRKAFVQ